MDIPVTLWSGPGGSHCGERDVRAIVCLPLHDLGINDTQHHHYDIIVLI